LLEREMLTDGLHDGAGGCVTNSSGPRILARR
jgi:hypothetical protein